MKRTVMGIMLMFAVLSFPGIGASEIDPESIVAMWDFDEGDGELLQDRSGNGNDGDLNGPVWEAGKFNTALDFDGQNDSVQVPDSESLNAVDDITITAWVYLRRGVTSGTWNALVGKHPYQSGYLMWIQVPNEPCGLVYSGGRFDNRSGIQLNQDTWYHLAFTRVNSGQMQFFIDGELVKEANSNAGEMTVLNAPISIGGQSPQVLDGLVDEIAIFNTALDEADINHLMKGFRIALSVSPTDKLATTWANLKDFDR